MASNRVVWISRILLLVFSVGLVGLVGEIGLRMIKGPPVVWKYPQESYERDSELGHRLKPNQSAYTHDKLFLTDKQGLRVGAKPISDATVGRRILALGDSQTAGDGLVFADTWPAQLERSLNEGAGRDAVRVVNAGVSGYAPWQYAIAFERQAGLSQFEAAVVAMYVNDIVPQPKERDVYVVTNSTSRRILYLLKRSALFTTIWHARFAIEQSIRPDPNFGWERRILKGEPNAWGEQGWVDFRAGLKRIRDLGRDLGLDVAIVILPHRDQVSGAVTERAYNDGVRAIAESLGMQVLDMLEPLQSAFEEHGWELFIAWDGHNSAISNRIVAQEIAARLTRVTSEGPR